MASTFVNPTEVAREALRQVKNNCVMGELVFRGYEEEWMKQPNGYKIGSSVTLKAPVYFRVQDGATINTVDLIERSTTFTLAYRKHVAWPVTSDQMTYSIDKMSKRFIQPAAQAIANYIDSTLLGLYKSVPAQVGTPNTTPSSFLTFAKANAYLSEMAVPESDRRMVVDPQAQAYMADALKGLFYPSIVGKAVEKAKFGMIAGFDTYMSQNVQTHTPGTWAGISGVTVTSTTAEGANTLALTSATTTTATYTVGDIFTIAAVNAVNPISGASTGSLRQFVIDTAGTFSTTATIYATPGTSPYAIYDASATKDYLPYQNVDVLPQSAAAVTIAGTASTQYKCNMGFHRDCLGLAMVPLEMPPSVVWKAQESYDGYTCRVIRDYDVVNDQEYIRFDVLFGVKVLNPFMGVRVAG